MCPNDPIYQKTHINRNKLRIEGQLEVLFAGAPSSKSRGTGSAQIRYKRVTFTTDDRVPGAKMYENTVRDRRVLTPPSWNLANFKVMRRERAKDNCPVGMQVAGLLSNRDLKLKTGTKTSHCPPGDTFHDTD